MVKLIGITGLPACGKTYIAKYICQATGAELIECDVYLNEILNTPLFSKLLNKGKAGASDLYENIKETNIIDNLENMNLIRKLEIAMLRVLGNYKLKSIIKNSNKPVIVDSCFLPLLKVAKSFDEIYLVQDINNERFAERMKRDDVSLITAMRIDAVVDKLVEYNVLKYKKVITNDYETIPNEVFGIIDNLNQTSNETQISR